MLTSRGDEIMESVLEGDLYVESTEVGELKEKIDVKDRMSVGRFDYGCKHYRRRCRIRAPCCNDIFDCRHCHNEAKNNNEVNGSVRHDIPRQRVEKVICSLCDYEQVVKQVCENCGVCMGDYYCAKCKFFDDETDKEQFHCDACGICRIGGRANFFHCDRCGSCYSNALRDGHPCVENAMHQNCPVCVEYLFDSVMDISVLPCGHTMHKNCLEQMNVHSQFTCPICSKSTQDMSRMWERLDQEVYLTPMPEEYRQKKVWVLCNDCGSTSDVFYHVVGHKCLGCGSYNTRSTSPPSERSESISPTGNVSGTLQTNVSSSVGSLLERMGRTIEAEMSLE